MTGDFLPIDGDVQELEVQPDALRAAVSALLWLAFVIALVCAPAVVIAAWRWAL